MTATGLTRSPSSFSFTVVPPARDLLVSGDDAGVVDCARGRAPVIRVTKAAPEGDAWFLRLAYLGV
jgi:hypothetical protein